MGTSRLRRAAKSFPVRAAVGADSWRPRHWALVSDQALAVLGYMFYVREQWQHGPHLTHVHIVLLRKPTGGHRPIALLVSLHRLWAKARLDLAKDWANQLGRDYIALGANRATTDVAARVLLHGEAFPPRKNDAAR
eukprot:4785156-Pyramimonas_sp.AAC.1